jgi:PB1 domain
LAKISIKAKVIFIIKIKSKEQMFIKFNYKTQKRKINTKINTMDELKSKAREIYGD